eukprot:TRINITY_DN16968_c0_g3_i1.p1 TRINITY_DN16968_c0_g3~~TRINITY_DN16968_c0_g3_i1.p1  ORF type:complete len:617 (+),score=199.38 TRINITY_DN16968_c0_g3_i1:81-1931(+)
MAAAADPKRRRTELPPPGVDASAEDVAIWLETMFPVKEYGKKFKKKGITGGMLRVMKSDHFKELGVDLTDELTILAALGSAAGTAAPAGAAPEKPVITLEKEHFDIEKCARIPLPDHKKIGVKTCRNKCLEIVDKYLQTEGPAVRVPPLMLSRCMRGGKTTILCSLFDQLQREDHKPIFLSFNGTTNRYTVKRKTNEPLLDCFIRAVGWALAQSNEEFKDKTAADVSCVKKTVLRYLEGKEKVVLLVDELNMLLTREEKAEDTEDIGQFIRQEFLDKKDRYFIFTTHFPIDSPVTEVIGKGGGSGREVEPINLPQAFDVEKLQGLNNCGGVTKSFCTYHAFIPSLIYEVCNYGFSISKRFESIWSAKEHEPKLAELKKHFLSEFFSGERIRDSPLRDFDSLTTYSQAKKVQWVLGYAGLLVSKFGWDANVVKLITNLVIHSEKSKTGQTWEDIVNIAIALHCYEALLGISTPHELLHLPPGTRLMDFCIQKVPDHRKTAEHAKEWWKGQPKNPSATFPRAVLLIPSASDFQIVDSLLLLESDATTLVCTTGFQMKEGQKKPNVSPPKEVSTGVWLEGDALKGAGTYDNGWQRPNVDEVKGFLGVSLAMLYPALKPH